MMHCCFLKIINEHNYNMKLFKATDGPFFYFKENNFIFYDKYNLFLRSLWFINPNKIENIDIIKITGKYRGEINDILPFYSTESILYKLINLYNSVILFVFFTNKIKT